MPEITVKSRSKSLKEGQFNANSLNDLKAQVSKANSRISIHRLRFTDPDTKKPITDESFKGTTIVSVKDLGPQMSWRAVYVVEYLGPILIHYLTWKYLAGAPKQYETLCYMNVIHYLKREFETLFVHQFSSATMPLFNLFKNCFHYWVLGGSLAVMYFDIGNLTFIDIPEEYKTYAFYIWIASETFNFITHTQLRLLGDKSVRVGKPRETPRGGFFELFIAPNYTFEIYSWIAIFVLNPNIFTLVFTIVGATQMYFWAIKKAKKYGVRSRKFLIPLIF